MSTEHEAKRSRIRVLQREMSEKRKRGEPAYRELLELYDVGVSLQMEGVPVPLWYTDVGFITILAAEGLIDDGVAGVSVALTIWPAMKRREHTVSSQWFNLSEPLVYKLLATDLSGALYGDLKLPLDAFLVELPPGMLYSSVQGVWEEIRVLSVTKGRVVEDEWRKAMPEYQLPYGDYLLVQYHPDLRGQAQPLRVQTFPLLEPHDPLSKRGFQAPHKLKLRVVDREVEGEAAYALTLNFILNLCLYLSSPTSSVVHQHAAAIEAIPLDAKPKKLRERTRLLNDSIFLVGTDVTIDNEVKECVRLGEEAYYKLTYRTMVRGHYRNQACGPKFSLRSVKWIEPHIRGKDLPTPVVGHNYTVK